MKTLINDKNESRLNHHYYDHEINTRYQNGNFNLSGFLKGSSWAPRFSKLKKIKTFIFNNHDSILSINWSFCSFRDDLVYFDSGNDILAYFGDEEKKLENILSLGQRVNEFHDQIQKYYKDNRYSEMTKADSFLIHLIIECTNKVNLKELVFRNNWFNSKEDIFFLFNSLKPQSNLETFKFLNPMTIVALKPLQSFLCASAHIKELAFSLNSAEGEEKLQPALIDSILQLLCLKKSNLNQLHLQGMPKDIKLQKMIEDFLIQMTKERSVLSLKNIIIDDLTLDEIQQKRGQREVEQEQPQLMKVR